MFNFKMENYVKKQLLIAACMNICPLMSGYLGGWAAPVVPKLEDISQTPLLGVITMTKGSWVGSTLIIGAIIGPLISGPLADIIGRKLCLVIGAIINLLAQFILIFASSLALIFAGRIISGFGTGILTVVGAVYTGEISSPDIRGIILTSFGVSNAAGSLLVYSVGPYVSYEALNCISIFLGFIFLVTVAFVPESPTFYIIKGDEAGAKKTLHNLGRDKDIDSEIAKIADQTEMGKDKKRILIQLFTIKSNLKSLGLTFGLFAFQQWSGVFAVSYFATVIFQYAESSVEPATATIIVGTTQLVGTLIVPTMIERSGRKTLLLISSAGCCFTMAILGFYFFLENVEHHLVPYIAWVPLVTLVLAFFSYSIGLSVVPETILAEVFTPSVRSIGSSISMTLGMATGVISVTSYGYLEEAIGNDFTFGIFALINAIAYVFIYVFLPETEGLTLAEIEKVLSK